MYSIPVDRLTVSSSGAAGGALGGCRCGGAADAAAAAASPGCWLPAVLSVTTVLVLVLLLLLCLLLDCTGCSVRGRQAPCHLPEAAITPGACGERQQAEEQRQPVRLPPVATPGACQLQTMKGRLVAHLGLEGYSGRRHVSQAYHCAVPVILCSDRALHQQPALIFKCATLQAAPRRKMPTSGLRLSSEPENETRGTAFPANLRAVVS